MHFLVSLLWIAIGVTLLALGGAYAAAGSRVIAATTALFGALALGAGLLL